MPRSPYTNESPTKAPPSPRYHEWNETDKLTHSQRKSAMEERLFMTSPNVGRRQTKISSSDEDSKQPVTPTDEGKMIEGLFIPPLQINRQSHEKELSPRRKHIPATGDTERKSGPMSPHPPTGRRTSQRVSGRKATHWHGSIASPRSTGTPRHKLLISQKKRIPNHTMNSSRKNLRDELSDTSRSTTSHNIISFRDMLLQSPLYDDRIIQGGGFVYLTRRHPGSSMYDLKVARRSEINRVNFITLSLEGLMFHNGHKTTDDDIEEDDEAEFVPMQDYEVAFKQFWRLQQLPFVQKYHRWRVLHAWYKYWRHSKYEAARSSVARDLFVLQSPTATCLTSLRTLMIDTLGSKYLFELPENRTYALHEFVQRQKDARERLTYSLNTTVEDIRSLIRDACDEELRRFLMNNGFADRSTMISDTSMASLVRLEVTVEPEQANEFQTGSEAFHTRESTTASNDALRETLRSNLPETDISENTTRRTQRVRIQDNTEHMHSDRPQEPITFAERAAMRRKCRRLVRFVRLCDFLLMDSLIRLGLRSIRALRDSLNPDTLHDTQTFKRAPLFEVEVHVDLAVQQQTTQDSKVSFAPDDTNATEMLLNPETEKLVATIEECTYDETFVRLKLSEALQVIKLRKGLKITGGVPSTPTGRHEDTAGLIFNPKCDAFKQSIENTLYDAITALGSSSAQLLHSQIFNPFLSAIIDESEQSSDTMGTNGRLDVERLLLETPSFQQMTDSIIEYIFAAFTCAEHVATCYQPFRCIILSDHNILHRISTQALNGCPTMTVRAMLDAHEREHAALERMPESLDIGVLRLAASTFKGRVQHSPVRCIHKIIKVLPTVLMRRTDVLLSTFGSYLRKLQSVPHTLEDYVDVVDSLNHAVDSNETWRIEEEYIRDLFEILHDYGIYANAVSQQEQRPLLTDDDKSKYMTMQRASADLRSSITQVENIIDSQTRTFAKVLDDRIPPLKQRALAARMQSDDERVYDPESRPSDVVQLLSAICKEVDQQVDEARTIQRYQRTLKVPVMAFDSLFEFQQDLLAKLTLWRNMEDWHVFSNHLMRSYINNLDVGHIRMKLTEYLRAAIKLERQREGLPDAKVVRALRENIHNVRAVLPVLSDLRCEALRARHWQAIREATGSERLTPEELEKMSLHQLLADEIDISTHSIDISRIAQEAMQEKVLLDMLKAVQDSWAEKEISMVTFKHARDMWILSDVDELQSMMDESFVQLHTVLASRYVAPLRHDVEDFVSKLSALQDVIDIWTSCQKAWMSLFPIFALGGGDIQRQLPNESKAFSHVDASFRDVCKRTREDNLALRVATRSGLQELLTKHNTTLEYVQHGLDSYMQFKRSKFPRFYFLSDEDLLMLLSQAASDPQAVQPHLNKLFDNINRLRMMRTAEGSSVDITHMISRESEQVSLGLNLKARSNTAVEDWMGVVEQRMRETLREKLSGLLQTAITPAAPTHSDIATEQQYPLDRKEWVFDTNWPSQLISTVAQIEFTKRIETAFHEIAVIPTGSSLSIPPKDNSTALQTCMTTQLHQIEQLTQYVSSELEYIQRQTVVALLIADVHNRDVLDHLIKFKVYNASDFSWQQQLRYYWEEEETGNNGTSGHGTSAAVTSSGIPTCFVRQGTTTLRYGYEYQGCSSRLVITPLTDRCWMTITSALAFSLGANPQGPAGTGKTESSKDLARNIGVQCIVFNCSEQIDYAMIGRIFAGIAEAGAWACLDEFNRISIEVLSVCAQQIRELHMARIAGKSSLLFEGRQLTLRGDYHVIATMNPGYAGRTELPENLQMLFRPVAMMIPDYSRIAEILLFSSGFKEAKALSTKLVTVCQLCSEQLSQQTHYDFGMRAVKSILTAAAHSIRELPQTSESNVLLQALCQSTIPKLSRPDLQLFRGIVRDVFAATTAGDGRKSSTSHSRQTRRSMSAARPSLPPSGLKPGEESSPIDALDTYGESESDSMLRRMVDRVLSSTGLSANYLFANKVVELDRTLRSRMGVAIIGSGAGKSIARQTLAIARCQLQVPQPIVQSRRRTSSSSSAENQNEFIEPSYSDLSNSQLDETVAPASTRVMEVNPKSLSLHELYGRFDELTLEWRDGLLSALVRKAVAQTEDMLDPHTKFAPILSRTSSNMTASSNCNECWIVLDGPIDALWVENLNTVLDDSRMLCLANGERIRISDHVRLLFECGDLDQASPATVSRLGVVYMPHNAVTWRMFAACQVQRLMHLNWLDELNVSRFAQLLDAFIGAGIDFVSRQCAAAEDAATGAAGDEASLDAVTASVEQLADAAIASAATSVERSQEDVSDMGAHANHSSTLSVISTFFSLLESTLRSLARQGLDIEGRMTEKTVDRLFLWCFTWSLGGTLSGTHWRRLDQWIRVHARKSSFDLGIPSSGLVFDYCLTVESEDELRLRPWKEKVRPFSFEPEASLHNVLVPTVDTTRFQTLMELLLFDARGSWESVSRSFAALCQQGMLAHEAGTTALLPAAFRPIQTNDDIQLFPISGAQPLPGASRFASPCGVSASAPRKPVLLIGPSGAGKSVTLRYLLRKYNITSQMDQPNSSSHQTDSKLDDAGSPSLARKRLEGSLQSLESYKQRDSALMPGTLSTGSILDGSRSKRLQVIPLIFSAQTWASDVQAACENKLQRLRKGLHVPGANARGIVFIEDLNLPAAEEYGAQPPLELVRQLADLGGMFHRRDFYWQHFQDSSILATCSPAGEGRSRLPHRLARQFSLISMPQPSTDIMTHMFSHILSSVWDKRFSSDIKAQRNSVVRATVDIYIQCRRVLKPTPSKSHYKFNMRDIMRVMQGLSLVTPVQMPNSTTMAKLWTHECCRVFRDRLVDQHDQQTFDIMLVDTLHRHIKQGWISDASTVSKQQTESSGPSTELLNSIYWTDFLDMNENSLRNYTLCESTDELVKALQGCLGEYNLGAAEPMDLIFFQDAVSHMVRLSRVLAQSRGHMLLVGVGGSGKQSLARLAAFVSDCTLAIPRIFDGYTRAHFREDLKELLRDAGLEQQPTMLLLTENSIVSETFLEDINSLLNNGEVPNLFDQHDLENIVSSIRGALVDSDQGIAMTTHEDVNDARTDNGTKDTRIEAGSVMTSSTRRREATMSQGFSWTDCLDTFQQRVQENLHVVVALSPASGIFRHRLRMFPALVNCCTINWVRPWPRSALVQVSERLLSSVQLPTQQTDSLSSPASRARRQTQKQNAHWDGEMDTNGNASPQFRSIPASEHDIFPSLVRACVESHESAQRAAKLSTNMDKMPVQFTPRTFLDFMQSVRRLIASRTATINESIGKYSGGVERLRETEANVSILQAQLKDLAPKLESKSRETEELLKRVQAEKDVADAKRLTVEGEERIVRAQQQEVEVLKTDAERDLEVAMPALENAIKSLDSLSKQDMTEMRSFAQPPPGVRTVMEAVCCLLDEKQDWDTAKKLLGQPSFIRTLQHFDKDNIPSSTLRKLSRYTSNPIMSVENVSKVSKAATSVCMWVHAIETYSQILRDVAPKRARLAEMSIQFENANSELRAKQDELDEIVARVNEIERNCQETEQDQELLKEERTRCEQRLQRAETLVSCLKSEGARWKVELANLLKAQDRLVGDSVLAASACVHLGPFHARMRKLLMSEWIRTMKSTDIMLSQPYTLEKILGNPVQIQEWHVNGLPTDINSVDSALVGTNGQRWPLFVDPHQQAVSWIKATETNALEVFNLSGGGKNVSNVTSKHKPGATVDYNEQPDQADDKPGSPKKSNKSGSGRALKYTLESVLEVCIRNGRTLLLEDCSSHLPPILDAVLNRTIVNQNGRALIRLGDRQVDYDSRFKLYLATREPDIQSRLAPEQSVRMNIINFDATTAAIEEQLLSSVVRIEKPEVEDKKHDLLVGLAADRKQLRTLESKVLQQIESAGEHILDRSDVVETLTYSQQMARVIASRVAEAESTARTLNAACDLYRPIAFRGALFFDTLNALREANHMYAYSLSYFRKLFTKSIRRQSPLIPSSVPTKADIPSPLAHSSDKQNNSTQHDDHHSATSLTQSTSTITDDQQQLYVKTTLNEEESDDDTSDVQEASVDRVVELLTASLFESVSKGLFEKDKVLFSVLLATRVDVSEGGVRPEQVSLFFRGAVPMKNAPHESLNPFVNTDKPVGAAEWQLLFNVDRGLCDAVAAESELWSEWRSSALPSSCKLPDTTWDKCLTLFEKLMVVRALSPDSVLFALHYYIEFMLGKKFIQFKSYSDLHQQLSDIDASTPCIFIVSRGADPTSALHEAAVHWRMSGRLHFISMGRSQESRAESIIRYAQEKGEWVCLQNCHVAKSWLPRLNAIVNQVVAGKMLPTRDSQLQSSANGRSRDRQHQTKPNTSFRLFLTSEPVTYFPSQVLQSSVKITCEPPQGFRAKFLRNIELLHDGWLADDDACIEDESNPEPNASSSTSPTASETMIEQQTQSPSSTISSNVLSLRRDYTQNDVQSQCNAVHLSKLSKQAWRKMAAKLCIFHAIAQERQRFGPIGFSIPYAFNDGDLTTSLAHVGELLRLTERKSLEGSGVTTSMDHIATGMFAWDAFAYLIGEITYGGRVTDSWDQRCLNTLLECVCADTTASNLHILWGDEVYQSSPIFPDDCPTVETLQKFGSSFSEHEKPEYFGLHASAAISERTQRTLTLMGKASRGFQKLDLPAKNIEQRSRGLSMDLSNNMQNSVGDKLIQRQSSTSNTQAAGSALSAVRSAHGQQIHSLELHNLNEDDFRVLAVVNTVKDSLPSNIDKISVPNSLTMPLCVVLMQETERLNNLLLIIRSSLHRLKSALMGESAISQELEGVYECLSQNSVPSLWKHNAYPSLRSLADWVADLGQRISFFKTWANCTQRFQHRLNGAAPNRQYWLGAFVFPKRFLTALKQVYSRQTRIPIDRLELHSIPTDNFGYTDKATSVSTASYEAEIYGLWLQGASWATKAGASAGELQEAQPQVQFEKMPNFVMCPFDAVDAPQTLSSSMYTCPVYRTTDRAGNLTSTGASTNFVFSINLPCTTDSAHWALRGTGIFLDASLST